MHKAGFVNIVGNPNVGKSTLMNALVGERISIATFKAQTTRHRIMGIYNTDDMQIVFSDTPGVLKPTYKLQESMLNFSTSALTDADVLLYVTDVVETPDKHNDFVEKVSRMEVPVLLLVNKIDLSNQEKLVELVEAWKELLPNAEIIPISAATKFNADYVMKRIKELLPDSPPYFDKDQWTDKPARFFVNEIIRQALIAGYLTKEVENYGLLKVTDAGKKFLKPPKSFKITEDNDFEEVEEEAPARGGGACAVDPALYSMLKDLRKKLSKKLEVPPYVIFQDPSLEAMATIYPITLDELQNIPGVGAGKAKRYGEEFCKLIKRHCEENEIERPEDLRVRTVANKSKMKVAIIQAIDRKVALDDIAMSKGIEFEELLDEIEAIVYSGTKLNIDYFLEDIMDEDHLLDIYDYFKESTTDNIDDALDELGDDFTEEEVRLVRIKFISEMAN